MSSVEIPECWDGKRVVTQINCTYQEESITQSDGPGNRDKRQALRVLDKSEAFEVLFTTHHPSFSLIVTDLFNIFPQDNLFFP